MIKYILCYNTNTIENIEKIRTPHIAFNTINELLNYYGDKNLTYISQYKIAVMKGNNCIEFLSMKKYMSLL